MIRIDEYKNYGRELENIKEKGCDCLEILEITIISE